MPRRGGTHRALKIPDDDPKRTGQRPRGQGRAMGGLGLQGMGRAGPSRRWNSGWGPKEWAEEDKNSRRGRGPRGGGKPEVGPSGPKAKDQNMGRPRGFLPSPPADGGKEAMGFPSGLRGPHLAKGLDVLRIPGGMVNPWPGRPGVQAGLGPARPYILEGRLPRRSALPGLRAARRRPPRRALWGGRWKTAPLDSAGAGKRGPGVPGRARDRGGRKMGRAGAGQEGPAGGRSSSVATLMRPQMASSGRR
jgi:hypothetical protein